MVQLSVNLIALALLPIAIAVGPTKQFNFDVVNAQISPDGFTRDIGMGSSKPARLPWMDHRTTLTFPHNIVMVYEESSLSTVNDFQCETSSITKRFSDPHDPLKYLYDVDDGKIRVVADPNILL
ncbi:hypothetical protein C0989_007489 [Termitomyces sp. Mn162]|nr:hypothetical protein C0989_007489 [Termitomyces sp. Mn162]